MKRQWFRDDDGTFYRNCNLIDRELRATWLRPWRLRRLARLQREWKVVWREGVIHKTQLERGDVEVKPVPFRVAYPNHPGLWRLDKDGAQ